MALSSEFAPFVTKVRSEIILEEKVGRHLTSSLALTLPSIVIERMEVPKRSTNV